MQHISKESDFACPSVGWAAETNVAASDNNVLLAQVLAAGAKAVAAVRSPKTSKDLQDLQLQYPEALTIVAMDTGVFPSVKVRPGGR